MPDLILQKYDGTFSAFAGGAYTSFANDLGNASTSTRFFCQKKFAVSHLGDLFCFNLDEGSDNVGLQRYDVVNDKFSQVIDITTDGRDENSVAIYSTGKKLIAIYDESVSNTGKYSESTDNGWTWSTPVTLASGDKLVYEDVIVFNGYTYFLAGVHTANGDGYLGVVSSGSFNQIDIMPSGGVSTNGHGSLSVLNGKLYCAVISTDSSTGDKEIKVFRIEGLSKTLVYTLGPLDATHGGTNETGISLFADPTNNKLYAYSLATTGNPADNVGIKTTDNTGNSWVQDDTIPANMFSDSTANGVGTIYNESLSNSIVAIASGPNEGTKLYDWNSGTEQFELITGSSLAAYAFPSIGIYRDTAAWCGINNVGISTSGDRQQLKIYKRKRDGTNITIDPKFTTNSEDWSSMTIDESKTGLQSRPTQIALDATNSFNEDFSIDGISDLTRWEISSNPGTYSKNVDTGTPKLDISFDDNNGNLERWFRKVVIASGNFEVSVDYNLLNASNTGSGNVQFYIDAIALSDSFNGEFLSFDNRANIRIDEGTGGLEYHVNHETNGTPSTTSSGGASSSGTLYIERTSGVFTTSYGDPKNSLNPGTQLNYSGPVLIMFSFYNNSDTVNRSIELSDLSLRSGTVASVEDLVPDTINWDFETDGITGVDVGGIKAKVIADV